MYGTRLYALLDLVLDDGPCVPAQEIVWVGHDVQRFHIQLQQEAAQTHCHTKGADQADESHK